MAGKSRLPHPPYPQGGQNIAQNASRAASSGLSLERIQYLRGLREKIKAGFYNTEPVLEDLSYSFTKAVDALIV